MNISPVHPQTYRLSVQLLFSGIPGELDWHLVDGVQFQFSPWMDLIQMELKLLQKMLTVSQAMNGQVRNIDKKWLVFCPKDA